MNNSNAILHIDLKNKTFNTKSYDNLGKFVGGVGYASFLIHEKYERDPVVFSVGPLNGYFPFASKTCGAYIENRSFHDVYGGGKLATRFRFSTFDALVLEGKSEEPCVLAISDREITFYEGGMDPQTIGTPGKRCIISLDTSSEKVLIDNTFVFGDQGFYTKLKEKGVWAVTISSREEPRLESEVKYEKIYLEILSKVNEMLIAPSNNVSCSGCPMGCKESKEGEIGGEVFIHSLVACKFAEPIYSDISLVFACLNTLGYDYSHEDLENLPVIIDSTVKSIYEKLSNS